MAFVSPVSTKRPGEPVTAEQGGYIVKPLAAEPVELLSLMGTPYYISQGQTNWHSKQVNYYTELLPIDLNWGNVMNSLRLRVFTPDGYVLGPFYDTADGRWDGRIYIGIYRQGGVAQGTWVYEVYGYRVSGTEDYYI